MFYASVLGQLGDLSLLNHALVPWRSAPVYLRLVNSQARALNYAAGGFHVAVSRGTPGGCGDSAGSTPTGSAGSCLAPLGRKELGEEWATVAEKYLRAYDAAKAAWSMGTVLNMLREANGAADRVYGLENVPPPRDPVTMTSEAPMANPTMPNKHKVLIATGLLGVLGSVVGIVAAVSRS